MRTNMKYQYTRNRKKSTNINNICFSYDRKKMMFSIVIMFILLITSIFAQAQKTNNLTSIDTSAFFKRRIPFLITDSLTSGRNLKIHSSDSIFYQAIKHKFSGDFNINHGTFQYDDGGIHLLMDNNYLSRGIKAIIEYDGDNPATFLLGSFGRSTYKMYANGSGYKQYCTYIQSHQTDADTVCGWNISGNEYNIKVKARINDKAGKAVIDNVMKTNFKNISLNSLINSSKSASVLLGGDTIYFSTNNNNKITIYPSGIYFNDYLKSMEIRNVGLITTDSLQIISKLVIYGKSIFSGKSTFSNTMVVHDVIVNGGLNNKDTLINLADSTKSYSFPKASTGWAEIYVDSLGYMVSFANFYWSINGSVKLLNNGSYFSNTNTANNHCLVDKGSYCALVNRRSTSYNYSIKYHYHF